MVMVEILTDNRNRTAPEIRKVFEKGGGALGATGSAAWMFQRKGVVVVPADQTDEESLMELTLEAGADEVEPARRRGPEAFQVTCPLDVVQRPLLERSSRPTASRRAASRSSTCRTTPSPSRVTTPRRRSP